MNKLNVKSVNLQQITITKQLSYDNKERIERRKNEDQRETDRNKCH